jgi:xanthine dehydrogenase small subunit
MRDFILLYINGKRHILKGNDAFMTLSDYLRYQNSLPGTKVVCAEGDCGACTVLYSSTHDITDGKLNYRSINSCIALMGLLDCSHIITVEGIGYKDKLHPVQQAFVESQGAQCGFCTPGFICALTSTIENRLDEKKPVKGEEATRKIMNGLTGNLCRCTGYLPIKEACSSINTQEVELMKDRYHSEVMIKDLTKHALTSLEIKFEDKYFFSPANLDDAKKIKKANPETKLISSATDLGVLINKEKFFPKALMTLNHITELHKITKTANELIIGGRVNFTKIENFIEKNSDMGLIEFAKILKIFASPQIKNVATLVGNVANASPIADSIPALMALNAKIEIQNSQATRIVPIRDFYLGYKKLDLKSDEIITSIHVPRLNKDKKLKLYKVSNRKDMDISTVTFAAVFSKEANKITNINLAYGGVGPVVKICQATSDFLLNKDWNEKNFKDAGKVLLTEITPISDVRSSKEYRHTVAKNLLLKFFFEENSQREASV